MQGALKNNSLCVKVSRWIANTLFHQVLAVVSIYAIWYGVVNYYYTFPWHVILSTLGYIPFMAEAILLFATDNVWTQELDRKTKYWIHGGLLVFSTVMLTAGNFVCTYVIGKDQPHFTTIHGITGLISMILVIISVVIGFMAAETQLFSRFIRPVWLKFIHNVLGIIAYIIGTVSLTYGFHTHWFVFYTAEETRLAASIATGLVAAWSLYAAVISGYNQIKNILSV